MTCAYIIGFNTSITDETVTFTDTSFQTCGVPTVAWLWDFGDGNGSTDQNPVHTYSMPDTYTVSLQVTWQNEATGNASNPVTTSNAPVPIPIIPPPTMTIAQSTAIMPYPSIKPSYVVIPVTVTVWTMLDMATRAWGSEYNAPDKNIYVFSNGRGFDSTDLSKNGVYGVIGDSGDFATLLIDNGYDDMQTELLTDNISISSPPNVGNPAQQNPETWQDVYELFSNQ